MWLDNIYEAQERDACRRFVVELWARLKVQDDEIARRLSISVPELREKYASELQSGPKKWTARAIEELSAKARAGDAEAGLRCLVATLYEHEPIAKMLSPSSGVTVH